MYLLLKKQIKFIVILNLIALFIFIFVRLNIFKFNLFNLIITVVIFNWLLLVKYLRIYFALFISPLTYSIVRFLPIFYVFFKFIYPIKLKIVPDVRIFLIVIIITIFILIIALLLKQPPLIIENNKEYMMIVLYTIVAEEFILNLLFMGYDFNNYIYSIFIFMLLHVYNNIDKNFYCIKSYLLIYIIGTFSYGIYGSTDGIHWSILMHCIYDFTLIIRRIKYGQKSTNLNSFDW